ncbi:MAG: hypothetical protein OXJ52_08120 [Oligoflexia bacterium]|nr:hypothetical protein [Oligoflexia bacterium]
MKSKNYQSTNLKYISEKRKKEVEEVFRTLGLRDKENLANNPQIFEDYNMPFKQFSILKNKKTIFSGSS